MPTFAPGRRPGTRASPRTRTSPGASSESIRAAGGSARTARGPARRASYPAAARRLWHRLARDDREVLWLYLVTRVGLWGTAYCVRWLFPQQGATRFPLAVLAPWQQWDWWHYQHIAQDGYFPGGGGPWVPGWDNREAFFPGFPLTLRVVHAVVPDWTAAGLLISFVAGGVAVLALARVARHALRNVNAGRRAVLFLLLSPCAVFLAAGYTEALFLALALPAWYAAQRHNWPLAGVLACLATTVRVSGLFLAAALAVHWLTTARPRPQWRALPWLALPALPPLLHSWYLKLHTGDWMAWKRAQERGWHRDFHTPWDALQHTWNAAFGRTQTTGYAVEFQAEILAMFLGLLLTGLLLYRRRWPEAVYIGLSLWALGTSYWYMSIPRATLLWWPLWVMIAAWSGRNPRVTTAYACLAAPLMTVLAVTFMTGHWAG
ncbi:mannosyltransferase family protein [Streptomyces sp. NPDC050355]|uniref:mannosyltransferase family protein n=1 Tax=Streptomyces sp. NPDC050355 TaxID=3365609 RepID=UPI0037B84544